MRIYNKSLYFIVNFLILASPQASSREISAEILQIKFNRIYLNIGSEELIFPDYNFWIIKNSDTVFTGKLETVHDGISISYPQEFHITFSDLEEYNVFVETAEIDTSGSIIFSYSDLSESEFSFILGDNSKENNSWNVNSIINQKIKPNEIRFSYSKIDLTKNKFVAPYLAVLVPNPSKEINSEGILTTSIYYIYNIQQLVSDSKREITDINCFWSNPDCKRAYNFSPEKGNDLLKNLKNKPDKIQISYSNESLKEQADYIADILAQKRIMVDVSKNNHSADLFLIYIPFDKSYPINTYSFILDFLSGFEILNTSNQETISIFNSYMDKRKSMDSTFNINHFYNIIDNGLKYDLSIFPLFRPTIYFNYGDEILYIKSEDNLKFDPDKIKKIIHPFHYREGIK